MADFGVAAPLQHLTTRATVDLGSQKIVAMCAPATAAGAAVATHAAAATPARNVGLMIAQTTGSEARSQKLVAGRRTCSRWTHRQWAITVARMPDQVALYFPA